MDDSIDNKNDSQTVKEIADIKDSSQLYDEVQDTKDAIKPEDTSTHPLEASPPSPPSPFECPFKGCGLRSNSQRELISHMDKESEDARKSLGK